MSSLHATRFGELLKEAEEFVFVASPEDPRDVLARLAARRDLPGADRSDRYGSGGPVGALEDRVKDLLGKPAAAFFPSGIMGQQSILRAWSDRARSTRIALPDLSHLLVHEGDGPRLLHGFDFVHLTTGAVTPTADDLNAIPGSLAAAVAELPLRDGGFLLPPWNDLTALADAARERGVPLHVDGARIWESQPFYDKPLDQIAALADSVYVSFYKGLGGYSGAVVAGPEDVVAEARQWRQRSGGTLYSLYPIALAALAGLEDELPLMGEYHARAKELAAAFTTAGLRTTPAQTNSMRVFAPASADEVNARILDLLETDKVAVTGLWRPAEVPGWSFTELVVTGHAMRTDVDRAATLMARIAGL